MADAQLMDQTARGYDAPVNTQFSVFLDNRCGKLMELVKLFETHEIDIVALSVMDSADHAVIRVVTSCSSAARRMLRSRHIPFSEADVLVVELERERTLAVLCWSLLSAELNIHYAYPLMVRPHEVPTIALHADDQVLAGQILRRKCFRLLGERDLHPPPTGEGDMFA